MNSAGLSPKNPSKYLGPNVYISSVVVRNRQPTGADFRQPETGKLYPNASYWLIGSDPTTGVQGELWYLSKIVANVAYWLMISSGSSGPLLNVQVQAATAPGVNPVVPTIAGLITINGASVAAHSVPVETRTRALNTFNIEVQYASAVASTDATKSGLAHFNSSQFAVDANGFVTLSGGGEAIDSLGVQSTSGAGTNPVVSDVNGKIEMQGALVAAGTNPLRAVSTAANTLQYQVQTSQALASTDATKVGLSNFSNGNFNVDANGFVSFSNGASVCSFQATLSASTVGGVTGNGAVYKVAFNTAGINVGSGFNTGTFTFTAPVTGKYLFSYTLCTKDLDITMTNWKAHIVTTSATYRTSEFNPGAMFATPGNSITASGSVICNMTAGNTAYCDITIGGAVANSANVQGVNLTVFSGELLC